MQEVILALLYCFGLELAFCKAEEQSEKEQLFNDYSYYYQTNSKPQEVLEILKKLKIGDPQKK